MLDPSMATMLSDAKAECVEDRIIPLISVAVVSNLKVINLRIKNSPEVEATVGSRHVTN